MNERLQRYVDNIFESAPKNRNTYELKEEILQNLNEKYNDLIDQGIPDQVAYNSAVAGVGDIRELIDSLGTEDSLATKYSKPAIVYTKEEIEKSKKRSALFISIAVMLYITSVIPPILISNNLGPVFLFLMIAFATGLIIYNSMTQIKPNSEKEENYDFKANSENTKKQKSVLGAVSSALWAITVVIYFLISFSTMDWHITWIIFLIAGAVNAVIKAVFDLRQ